MSKNLENLPPLLQQISELLSRRAADLLNLIQIKEHALKNAPDGSVRIVQRRNNVLQFYKKTEAGDYQGSYMPREEDALARCLVQKDYDQRVLEKAKGADIKITKKVYPGSTVSIDSLVIVVKDEQNGVNFVINEENNLVMYPLQR